MAMEAGRNWSYAATSQGMLGATKIEEEAGKDSSLVPSEGEWSCQKLDFRLLASRTLRGYISVF